MRRLGQFLAITGIVIGGVAALGMSLPIDLHGLSWLIAVGMVKLTFASSLGLIAGGAVLQRIGKRAEAQQQLEAPK